jgi:hypothetical protein
MWLSTGSGLSGRTRALVWVDGARAGTLDFTPLPKAQNTVEHTFEAVAPFKAAEHRRLVERLRAGRRMRLQRLEGENPSPNPARGVPFSLAGSSREIARVMAACPVAPAGPSGLDVAAAKAAEISRACQDGTGYFEPRGVIEADLNGDGRQDLALSHHGIVCDEGGRSIYCGAKLCSYHVFLDTGRGLADVHDGLSIGMSLGEGDPPQVRVFAGDGSEHALVWTGNGFAVRPR